MNIVLILVLYVFLFISAVIVVYHYFKPDSYEYSFKFRPKRTKLFYWAAGILFLLILIGGFYEFLRGIPESWGGYDYETGEYFTTRRYFAGLFGTSLFLFFLNMFRDHYKNREHILGLEVEVRVLKHLKDNGSLGEVGKEKMYENYNAKYNKLRKKEFLTEKEDQEIVFLMRILNEADRYRKAHREGKP